MELETEGCVTACWERGWELAWTGVVEGTGWAGSWRG